MPRDGKGQSTDVERSGFQEEFAHRAGTPASAPAADTSLARTVSAQTELARERKEALDRHDARWKLHRGRLASHTEQAPALGLDGEPVRDIKKQYEDMRTRWEMQRDAINRDFDGQVADVRRVGTTVTHEFAEAGSEPPARDFRPHERGKSRSR